jgi:hypothetical protein
MANELMNPHDKQNVPKAVRLFDNLLKIEDLEHSLNPTEVHHNLNIKFMGILFSKFIRPFTYINMSLSDQIVSLGTYAHLVAALYLKYEGKFMNSALYADSQAIVKNIIFQVA